MKYIAQVKQVLHSGIHTIGAIENGDVKWISQLPLPDRLEIELDGAEAEPCMMYRYTNEGALCGDTWHESLDHAFQQAEHEYGLKHGDFERAE